MEMDGMELNNRERKERLHDFKRMGNWMGGRYNVVRVLSHLIF